MLINEIGEIDSNVDGRFFVPTWDGEKWRHYRVEPCGRVVDGDGNQVPRSAMLESNIHQAVVAHIKRVPQAWLDYLFPVDFA